MINEEKMQKTKAPEELNVELFIVESNKEYSCT